MFFIENNNKFGVMLYWICILEINVFKIKIVFIDLFGNGFREELFNIFKIIIGSKILLFK